jgi:hypothetical protein
MGGTDPNLIVSAITAVLQAVQTWYAHKDARRAADEMDKLIGTGRTDPEFIRTTEELQSLVPPEVFAAIERRIEACWVRYAEILEAPVGKYSEAEITAATEVAKTGICTELSRVKSLAGQLPPGKLSSWWKLYGCG